MNHGIDPYAPPKVAEVSSPDQPVEGRWKVDKGSLWVKDGAVLPDICLYGSAAGRRSSVKVLWLSRAGNVLNWTLALLGTCALLGYSWIMRPGLSEMMAAILIAAVALSAIHATAFKRNWKRHRITIRRSKGWKAGLRVAAAVCAFYAIFSCVIIGFDYYRESAGFDQTQKIGIGNSLFFLWMTATHAAIVLQLVRAVEAREGWHRLEGVHPRALEALSRVQGEPPDENPGT